jgi:hypothetical protein
MRWNGETGWRFLEGSYNFAAGNFVRFGIYVADRYRAR